MDSRRDKSWSRREFLSALTIAGATRLLGVTPEAIAAEPPPETTKLRLGLVPSICVAPQYVAEDLLRSEGFTDIQYVGAGPTGLGALGVPGAKQMGTGGFDVSMNFATRNPAATKRALRAILKADRICALEPERAARAYLGRGFPTREDYAVQAVKEIPYGRWRDYDPEDTVRFYALRLHEAGMIKSSPKKIIAQGTDWRFLKELKKELKT